MNSNNDKPLWDEEETEERMEIIGQNGNTGDHYDLLDDYLDELFDEILGANDAEHD